jgi:pyruvate dehydrogenase complex dehydrogenase (E1) component
MSVNNTPSVFQVEYDTRWDVILNRDSEDKLVDILNEDKYNTNSDKELRQLD